MVKKFVDVRVHPVYTECQAQLKRTADMTLLEHALANVYRGLRIFPLEPDGKKPIVRNWEEYATDDPEIVQKIWKKNPAANIGVACGPSDLVVLDIDMKHGKNGLQSLEKYESKLTFSVSTPTGGVHHYYSREVPCRNSVDKLGEGLDTRADGGYVVGAGSVIQGTEYEIVNDTGVVAAPPWLLNGHSVEAVIKAEATAQEVDFSRAEKYLITDAPPAIQGQGGDHTTYQVACRLRDFGLTDSIAIMIERYNPRCEPPWSIDDLTDKVHNAYKYSQNSLGSDVLPFDTFQDASTESAAGLVASRASDLTFDIPKRDWVLGRILITGFVTVTVAPGGVGKSMYTMVEAIAVATGRPLLGTKPTKQGAVIIYNTEDPLDEIQRRVLAIAMQYSISLDELSDVYLLSGLDEPLRVAITVQGATVVTQDADRLAKLITETEAVLLCVDPFIRTHRVEENNNNAIDTVVQCFARLANQNKCAVSIVHHTRKQPAGTGAGDMDTARGASALVSAARIATTITVMSDKEAKHLQIPLEDRHWYVRTDSAKGNMSAPAKNADWFKKISITLPNSDSVGTLEPADLTENYMDAEALVDRDVREWHAKISAQFGVGLHPFSDVARWYMDNSLTTGSITSARRVLAGYYEAPVTIGNIRLAYSHENNRTPMYCLEIVEV